MKEINCDIIQDLLPLYVDDVCSDASKQLINTHLPTCDDCQKQLDSFKEDVLPIPEKCEENIKEIQPLKRMKRLKKWLFFMGGIIIALLVWIFMYMSIMGYPMPMFKSQTLTYYSKRSPSSDPIPVLTDIEFDNYLIHVFENTFENEDNNFYEIEGFYKLTSKLYSGEIVKFPIKVSVDTINGGTFDNYRTNIGYILGHRSEKLDRIHVNLSNGEQLAFDAQENLFFIPFEYPQNTNIVEFELLDENGSVFDTFIPGEDKPANYDCMTIDEDGTITYEQSIIDEDGNYIRSEIIPFDY